MCPSDIFHIPVRSKGFGPGSEVFSSEQQHPCSIAVKDYGLANEVRIQVQRDDTSTWKDYVEGELLIGKRIKCRIACGGGTGKIAIEVFHT